MKQKNKRIPINKTNSINSNKVENNMGNDGKKVSSTKSSCDFKKLLCIGRRLKKKFKESKNMNEERKEEKDFLHKALGNLLHFHPLILSGTSVVGMIYYFVYFGFELKYFPDLGGSDVAYVGVLLFFILTIISLFIILPCLVYPGYYENKKNKTWMFYFGLSLLPFLILVCMAILNTITITKPLYELLPYSLIVLGFYLGFVFVIEQIKVTLFKCIFKCIKNIVTIIAIIAIFVYIYKIYFLNVSLGDEFLSIFLVVVVHIITLCFFKGLEYFYKKNDYKLLLVTVSTVVLVILYPSSGTILHWLGMTNIEYKYLSIEKSVAGALPEKICKNGKCCDDSKTYYDKNETGGVIKLYNIKALSTLGKFYYLEAIGCEKNEKIRFELDSSKIISREKQER